MSGIVITGTMARGARKFSDRHGAAFVYLDVVQEAPTAPEVEACWPLGSGHAAHYSAEKSAQRLQPGTRVRVYASSINVHPFRRDALHCVDVTLVELLDLPAHYSEQAGG